MLRAIEAEAQSKRLPIIGPTRGTILDEVVLKHKPKRILEIGTLVGYSAIRMGRLLSDGGSVTCVDDAPQFVEIAKSNVERAGLADRVEILTGDALSVVPGLTGEYDMVFIDADKSRYLDYLMACDKLLHPGSVVVADNVKRFAREVTGYLEYVRNSGLYLSTYREEPAGARFPAPDAVEISVRK